MSVDDSLPSASPSSPPSNALFPSLSLDDWRIQWLSALVSTNLDCDVSSFPLSSLPSLLSRDPSALSAVSKFFAPPEAQKNENSPSETSPTLIFFYSLQDKQRTLHCVRRRLHTVDVPSADNVDGGDAEDVATDEALYEEKILSIYLLRDPMKTFPTENPLRAKAKKAEEEKTSAENDENLSDSPSSPPSFSLSAFPSSLFDSIEFGVFPGHSLRMLEALLKDVFLPLGESNEWGNAKGEGEGDGDAKEKSLSAEEKSLSAVPSPSPSLYSSDSLRVEFVQSVNKFRHHVSTTIQQVEETIELPIPMDLHDKLQTLYTQLDSQMGNGHAGHSHSRGQQSSSLSSSSSSSSSPSPLSIGISAFPHLQSLLVPSSTSSSLSASSSPQLAHWINQIVHEDEEFLTQLDLLLDGWISLISSVMENELRKKAVIVGPMGEIQFWKDRHANLSALYEQLNTDEIRCIIRIMEIINLNSMDLFKKHLSDLLKLYVESKDNVKFLTTLERHFKNLSSGNLSVIYETIPSMMNSLRMVWIISRHYNKDSRMFPLMERIAREIADKVAAAINVKTLFKKSSSAAEVVKILQKGKDVLECWHSSYMAVRDKLEGNTSNSNGNSTNGGGQSNGTSSSSLGPSNSLSSSSSSVSVASTSRWEFNRNQLFDRTQYMTKICENLLEVAETLDQFNSFLGPELKAVTGDSKGIDEVAERVRGFIIPLESLDFNIFDIRFHHHWEQQMALFHSQIIEIESKTKQFINSSFQKLRSAEGAFDLLLNFQHLKSRESIQKQMMEKFDDILIQYSREVERVKKIFEQNKENPPISLNQPVVAGSIQWSRSLYYRIKKSVLKFQTMPQLLESERGKMVSKEYVAVARMLTNYEKTLLGEWQIKCLETAAKRLKEFIFKYEEIPTGNNTAGAGDLSDPSRLPVMIPPAYPAVIGTAGLPPPPHFLSPITNAPQMNSPPHTSTPSSPPSSRLSTATGRPAPPPPQSTIGNSAIRKSSGASAVNHSTNSSQSQSLYSSSSHSSSVSPSLSSPSLSSVNRRIQINFSPELLECIREAKYLDRMGLAIPEIARQLLLQEAKYMELIESLKTMLKRYYEVLDRLTKHEKRILVRRMKELQRVMKSGFDPLNWNSLGIPSFIQQCERGISFFESIVNSVKKNSDQLDSAMKFIRNAKLIPISEFEGRETLMAIEDFQEKCEKYRYGECEELVAKYKGMSPTLIIIENNVCETESGSAEDFFDYYAYWEKKLFSAFTQMVATGLRDFLLLLRGAVGERKSPLGLTIQPGPILKVTVEMNVPSIIVSPNLQDIYKSLSKLLRNIPESCKLFYRWLHGQCHQCPIVPVNEEESVQYTFYDDISKSSLIVPLMLQVTQYIQKVIYSIDKYIESWNEMLEKYQLWNPKKLQSIERLKYKHKNTQYYEKYLYRYHNLIAMLSEMPPHKDIDFIRLDCLPLITAISKQAREWKFKYGEILKDSAVTLYVELDGILQGIHSRLHRFPLEEIEDLKIVLLEITSISQLNLSMELKFAELDEKIRTMNIYGIEIEGKGDKERVEKKSEETKESPEESKDSSAPSSSSPSKKFLPAIRSSDFATIRLRWESLKSDALTKDSALTDVKQKLKEETKQQIITFKGDLENFRKRFDTDGPGTFKGTIEEGAERMRSMKSEFSALSKHREDLIKSEKLFSLMPTSFGEFYVLSEEITELEELYSLYNEYKDGMKKWAVITWADMEIGTLNRQITGISKSLKKVSQRLKSLHPFRVFSALLNALLETLPLFSALKQDAIRERHWKEIIRIALSAPSKSSAPPSSSSSSPLLDADSKTFPLGRLFSLDLWRFKEEISRIALNASQEAKIERDIQKIAKLWGGQSFSLSPFNGDESSGYLLQDCSEILLEVEDNALTLQAMANSPFAASFLPDIRQWESSLNTISECIQIWQFVQRKWLYLEGIFIQSEDIRLQLPEPAKRFDRVDQQYRKIMLITAKQPNVLLCCSSDHRGEDLRALSGELDKCQKSLSDYLDRKRNAFPRFFFISDDELLSVLGSSKASSIQQHIQKLFQQCKALTFQRGETLVSGMDSGQLETFEFKTPVAVDGPIELWMTNVEAEMQRTLRHIAKESVFHYASSLRTEWIDNQLGMMTIVGSQIWWTWEVEDAFRHIQKGNKGALKTLSAKLTTQLHDLVLSIRDSSIGVDKRKKLNTLVIIDVHARDIIDRFVRDSVTDSSEFEWESQLRFYWDREDDTISIKQCSGSFVYGYEYLGLDSRLVITPLTDRCYMTLTQAVTFRMGGSPAGPAGTGKTETVKDLAKALGLGCSVVNCSEGLDYKVMGDIFSGLVQTGFWGCFDEFNRIDVEVLSVVSSQLQTIQAALNAEKRKFEFLGKEITLNPTVGFFITMNPGYAGRTELPDNLKSLFRPVTMIVPDMLQIAEIMLFSEGFSQARQLAKKMTVLYKLSSEQLSKQFHYDFGLRAMKSLLVMAGQMKRESPEYSEELVLMRGLRDMNVPKFVAEDVPLFLGLIGDLFPGMDCPRVTNKILKAAIIEDLEENNYKHTDDNIFQLQVDKVMQLYETILTRHTVMLVGPTQGGKTVVLQTLARAMLKAFKTPTKLYVMNPKMLSVSELYGVLDPVSRDWKDGLLSKIYRDINEPLKVGQLENRFIVFDGDVDAIWVESMNSVMDDNKLLTLPQGERIRLEDHCKLLFEVSDLQFASPATVSRCGMVFLDPKNLGFAPHYHRWAIQRCGEDEKMRELLFLLYAKYMQHCVDYVSEGVVDGKPIKEGPCETIIPLNPIGLVKQFCSLVTAIMPTESEWGIDSNFKISNNSTVSAPSNNPPPSVTADGEEKSAPSDAPSSVIPISSPSTQSAWQPIRDPDVIESLYIWCLIWGIGGALSDECRIRFDKFVKNLSNRPCVATPSKNHLPEEPIYEYYFNTDSDPNTNGGLLMKWYKWEPQAYVPPSPFDFHRILVPTIDTMRYTYLLSKYVKAKIPLLFVGETGTAKTTIVKNFLNRHLDVSHYLSLISNFSSRTTSLDVQLNIESQVDKRTGHIYGPPNGKQLLLFFDDLNMPKVDQYGTMQPIALLKFLMDKGQMYERGGDKGSGGNGKAEALAKKTFRDLLFIGAMAPPGGGRSPLDPRFVSLFSVISINFPSDVSLHHIYSSILSSHLSSFPIEIQRVGQKIPSLTLQLYKDISTALPPTPNKFHYIFNVRDLSRVFEGLLLATPQKFSSPTAFVKLWRNECLRVFHDRLNEEQDRALVKDKLIGKMIHHIAQNSQTASNPPPSLSSSSLSSAPSDSSASASSNSVPLNPDAVPSILKDPSYFGDFRHLLSPSGDLHWAYGQQEGGRAYEEMGDMESVQKIFNSVLKHYNEEGTQGGEGGAAMSSGGSGNSKGVPPSPMNLVLFSDCLDHLIRLHRILRFPRGHALLVGVGGSGKQSLTKLAAYTIGYRVFEVKLTRHYNEEDFREDLKSLYHIAGVERGGQPVVFLFTDGHCKDESFLEMVNNMLTTGMIPTLFSEEEKIPLMDSVRNEVKSLGLLVNNQNCWQHFITKCANNLHIVLCMSPAGDSLRRRCRSFPGLINNAVIDWFFPWPESALIAVANHFLSEEERKDKEQEAKAAEAAALTADGSAESKTADLPIRQSFSSSFSPFRESIVRHMVKVHSSISSVYSPQFESELRRSTHVTPKNYLDYIVTYITELKKSLEMNIRQWERLAGGLTKLIEAGEAVATFGKELEEKKAVVDVKSKECSAMITQIRQRQKEVENKQKQCGERESLLVEDNQRISYEKGEAEKALTEAEPELEAAALALQNLRKEDIAEVRVMPKPPIIVQLVCQCVVELKPVGNEDPSQGWAAAKLMMSDANFLQKLKAYPKDNITDRMISKVNKILRRKPQDPKQKLTQENLQRVSRAAAGLLQWVLAIVNYNKVAKNVEPRRKKVRQMEKEKTKSEEDLLVIQTELKELQGEINDLKTTYKQKSEELKDLEEKAEQMEKHLIAASQLINGLGSERTRWTAEKERLMESRQKLVGDCLLAAAFLSYCGPFTWEFRKKMVNEDWFIHIQQVGIPISTPFNLISLLTTEVQISQWASQGLPSDELSIQNGILTSYAKRFPLCIDPQLQATQWIKQKETQNNKQEEEEEDRETPSFEVDSSAPSSSSVPSESKGSNPSRPVAGRRDLKIRTFNDGDYMRQLELSIQFGNPFLFENVGEEFDPLIDPVLEKKFLPMANGGTMKAIQIGDSTIDWNDDFRLYLITKLANPKFSPEISAKTMIINYSVTMQGLEEQLLNVVIGHEREDLQNQREELIQTISSNNITLKELEDSILQELTSSQGNILDNSTLIATLKDAKSKTVAIAESLTESKMTREEIEKVTNSYRPAAKRGALLFFAMSSLSTVNPMYEFSLSAYLEVFTRALLESPPSPSIPQRVSFISDTLTKYVYDYTCCGLFERHKLMFSLQLTTMLMESEGMGGRGMPRSEGEKKQIREELDFFLKGNTSLESKSKSSPSVSESSKPIEWLPDSGWKDLQKLSTLKTANPLNFNAADSAESTGAAVSSPGPFSTLLSDISNNIHLWEKWFDLERPEDSPLPCGYSATLSPLQFLLILRCFRPDRVYSAVKSFIISQMKSDYFVQPPILKYDRIFQQSGPLTPVVFILSPGADPLSSLQDLAKQQGFYPQRFKSLALGQGQSKVAEKLLENGYMRGHWIVLQNCHLLQSWLKTLEKILNSMTKPHKDFRLWLTTDPTPNFPLGILQKSLKVVTEPPDGLKLNLKSSFAKLKQSDLDECPHPAFKPLVYVLAFFHAVLQERRKYDRMGYNISYDFNDSDFNVSRRLLATYLTKAFFRGGNLTMGEAPSASTSPSASSATASRPLRTLSLGIGGPIPWASLRYLIGECMYGGRVTDSFDRRILITYLEEYMGDFLFDPQTPFSFAKVNGVEYSVPLMNIYFNEVKERERQHEEKRGGGNAEKKSEIKESPTAPLPLPSVASLSPPTDLIEKYRDAIDRLPLDNSPQVFGLHSNAEIRYNTTCVKDIWRNLIDLQPRAAGSSAGHSREEIIGSLCRDILSVLPSPFDIPLIKRDWMKRLIAERAKEEKTAAGKKRAKMQTMQTTIQSQNTQFNTDNSTLTNTSSGNIQSMMSPSPVNAPPSVSIVIDSSAATAPSGGLGSPRGISSAQSNDGKTTLTPMTFAISPSPSPSPSSASSPSLSSSLSSPSGPPTFSPTTIVLFQELERFNKLINKMRDSLTELQRALSGIVGMSAELEDLSNALFNGFLPNAWRRLAPQTQKSLSSWISHFQQRFSQYSKWLQEQNDPKVIWLSGLHIPESYLTAMIQTTCRKKRWPLDKSTLYTKVTQYSTDDEITERPSEGFYVSGIFLEGADWDRQKGMLTQQIPKKLVDKLPILHVIPIEANRLKLTNTIRTPVYVTQNRRNAMGQGLVFEADLATNHHSSHWILQGTALTLNTDN